MPAPRDPRCKLRAGTRRPGGYPVTAATSARRRAVHLHAIDATSPLDPPRARRRLMYGTRHTSLTRRTTASARPPRTPETPAGP